MFLYVSILFEQQVAEFMEENSCVTLPMLELFVVYSVFAFDGQ